MAKGGEEQRIYFKRMECMIEHLRFKIEGGILELVKFEWGVSKMMGEEGTY